MQGTIESFASSSCCDCVSETSLRCFGELALFQIVSSAFYLIHPATVPVWCAWLEVAGRPASMFLLALMLIRVPLSVG